MENYFEFYELEPAFHLDQEALRNAFLAKSKAFHPDFFINDEEAYEKALEMTSINNKAYKALSDLKGRHEHILQLHGLLAEKEVLPPDFLMEMMEMNEALMDAKMEEDQAALEAVHTQIDGFADTLNKELEQLAERFDGGEKNEVLEALKINYYKQKYLRRINTFRS